MVLRDSVDKIVTSYFPCVTKERFEYKDETYNPIPLRVSPLIFRGMTCPANCGACCSRFSLDYLPQENHPYHLETRPIEFAGRIVHICSDLQKDRAGEYYCRNLDERQGRCNIHLKHPFSCDFEVLRFKKVTNSKTKIARLSNELFGRGWAMKRIDGYRGARCEMTPISKEHVSELLRKLGRLRDWTEHFGILTCIDEILDWVTTGPHENPLYVNQEFQHDAKQTHLLEGAGEKCEGESGPISV